MGPLPDLALRVSANGSACGVAWVPLSLGDRHGFLQVSVVPKFWEIPETAQVDLGENSVARPVAGVPAPVTKVVVRETGYLLLSGCKLLVEQSGDALCGLKFDSDEGQVTLFDEIPRRDAGWNTAWCQANAGTSTTPAHHGEVQSAAMWKLVASEENFTDLIKRSVGDEDWGYLGGSLLGHVEELRPLLCRWLIQETELALSRRRPQFRTAVAELGAIRGRLVPAGLVTRAARHRVAAECEYTELDHDHPWQRLLRAANRVAAAEVTGGLDLAARAGRLDRMMHDVTRLSSKQALHGMGRSRVERKNRHARQAVWLARALLQGLMPGGPGDDPSGASGVAVGLRFSTAELFERMLDETGGTCGSRTIVVAEYNTVRHGQINLHDPAGDRKSPDLVVESVPADGSTGEVLALFDAKYKEIPATWGQVAMGDQYQQYAYAVVSGKPVVLVYADADADADAKPVLAACVVISRDLLKCAQIPPMVAVAGVPFPPHGDIENFRGKFWDGIHQGMERVNVCTCATQ